MQSDLTEKAPSKIASEYVDFSHFEGNFALGTVTTVYSYLGGRF